ncbi:uncharacterized protein LOC141673925 [Apium graveolens]|uniref:uncharacterized protein LOC141673925 n=1 Tax=Apium graveolens TaxID=4045 RepID=UPI003D78D843
MACPPLSNRKEILTACVVTYKHIMVMLMETIVELVHLIAVLNIKIPMPITYVFDNCAQERLLARHLNLRPIIQDSDVACLDNLRMDRACFYKLCEMLRDVGGLHGSKNSSLEEVVTIFLYVLSHDTKNRRVQLHFKRSGETVSRYFNSVLRAIIRCNHLLLKKPQPVTEDCQDERWMWFQVNKILITHNCLGALDGTHIKVRVGDKDKARFRNRKGELTTNVLAACSCDMQFTYILPGWEGSTHDNRVLRDSLSRKNCLKVPQGYYYLCDAGYMNCDEFLTPYRAQRYHLNVWKDGAQPTSAEEYFNMRHSQARNVIERCFGLLKMRWGILRNITWYSRKTVGRIILACALMHNFIRTYMNSDPLEHLLRDNMEDLDENFIGHMESSNAWSTFRNNLAHEMYNAHLRQL